MKLILILLTLCNIFSACNSGSTSGQAGKKDTLVIRDTVTVISKHSTRHIARKDNENQNEAPANNAGYDPKVNPPVTQNQPVTDAPQQKDPAKKGWSAAAKDATIGGASGAAAGALLDGNNRLVGGAIGAALGTGAGYLIGRARDRKTGRVVKYKPDNTNSTYPNQ